jgi:hypothetical protein
MTISAAPNFVTYTAAGGVADFSFDKPVYVGTTLKVYTYEPGVDDEPQLVNPNDYTVTVDPDFLGATVTFDTAPDAGIKVGIIRVLDLEQTLAIGQSDFVSPADLENALDRITLMLQQVSNEAFQPVTDDPFGLTASARVGMPATFDADGKIVPGDGRTVYSGNGAPSLSIGIVGDFYIDTTDYDIYGPKQSGSWGTGTSLIGPQGPVGNQGPQGVQGNQGPAGADGDDAYVYIAYASDASGTGFTMTFNASLDYIAIKTTTAPIAAPGASDFAGLWKKYKGEQGPQGDQGPQGNAGNDGADGALWYSGSADPGAGTGVNGDFYIQTGNGATGVIGDVWQKASGTWSIVGNIRGAPGAGADTFLDLTDAPDTYTGQSLKVVRVKGDETGVEFRSVGIGDNALVEIDDAAAASGQYARFTANGIEGRTEAEFKADFNLEIGTDVQAQDADLQALADNSSNGLWARTGAGTGAARTITGTGTRLTVSNGNGVSGNPTLDVGTSVALLDAADQTVTGGARVTSLSLGSITSGTVTPDPGDRFLQHYTNGGAHTLAPGTNRGAYMLDIENVSGAGAITTSGWTKVVGSFTTTVGNKFRCHCSIGEEGSLLIIQALQ